MVDKKKYRVGVIGRTGRGDYGHGLDRVWLEIDGAEIVALADEDKGGREKKAKDLGVSATYADYREMLAKERPDIVSVCPRHIDAHRDMVLACAEYGASMFLEKPMCRDLTEADEMVRACEMSHVKLAIAHQTRYNPRIPVAKKIIADELGQVLEFRGRGKEDRRGGGQDLWVLGTHVFDLMRYYGGNVAWCFATVRAKGRPVTKDDVYEGEEGIGPLAGDAIDAMFGFENGVTGYFSTHREMRGTPSRFGLAVYGSKGVLEMTPTAVIKVLLDSSWSPGRSGKRWLDVTTAGIDKPESGKIPHGNVLVVKDLIRSIEADDQPLGSIYEARGATEMIAAVFESHRQRGPVKLPLENRKNPLTML